MTLRTLHVLLLSVISAPLIGCGGVMTAQRKAEPERFNINGAKWASQLNAAERAEIVVRYRSVKIGDHGLVFPLEAEKMPNRKDYLDLIEHLQTQLGAQLGGKRVKVIQKAERSASALLLRATVEGQVRKGNCAGEAQEDRYHINVSLLLEAHEPGMAAPALAERFVYCDAYAPPKGRGMTRSRLAFLGATNSLAKAPSRLQAQLTSWLHAVAKANTPKRAVRVAAHDVKSAERSSSL